MKHLFLALGLTTVAGLAQAQLYSNGPVVNSEGQSVLSVVSQSTFGVVSNADFTVADNFVVTGPGWNVEKLDFFAYQTDSVGFTFTDVTWSIRRVDFGFNPGTAVTVASGSTAVTNGGFVGFRVIAFPVPDALRPIWRISADTPDLSLLPGEYFLTWALAGTGNDGPVVPPVLGSYGIGDGGWQQATGGSFIPVRDARSLQSFDLPFEIQGSVVPEPAAVAMMLAGGLAVLTAAKLRRARTGAGSSPAA
ncbi:MAG: PEP-CTERM sorting domain-containing protein [Chitinophagaceae bacterium]|nr:PEP-CTERM sorting domain-containing protein [Rubrivivax sp.]